MSAFERVRNHGRAAQNQRVSRAPREPKAERGVERKENQRRSVSPSVELSLNANYKVGPADSVLMATVIGLIAFGLVMVYSASQVWAHLRYHDDHRFLLRQAMHAALGCAMMVGLSYFDYRRLRSWTYWLLTISLVLLVATTIFGRTAGGATRWLKLGPFSLQAAEPTKLAFICWLAYSLSNKTARIQSFFVGFLPHILVACLVAALCLFQPDFGSAVMIGLLLFCMMFTAGVRFLHLLGAALVMIPLLCGIVMTSDYRMHRIQSFLSNSENYQIRESWMSFGAGGLTGVGIGDSHQKLLFLPEAHTDFISAIVGEELGLVGFTIMVAAFLVVVYRGVQCAFRAVDEYGTYLAVGITLFLGTQTFTNLAVAVGLFPTKGLVLPFISYGGSSLLVNCCCVGILLNVSRPRSLVSFQAAQRPSAQPRVLGGVA